MKHRSARQVFVFILILTTVAALFSLPENFPLKFNLFGFQVDIIVNPPVLTFERLGLTGVRRQLRTHLGLDLSGGSQVTLEADMSKLAAGDRTAALESAKDIIERRVNFFGISEPVVQTVMSEHSYRINIELPGITDLKQAVTTIGQTAQLEFREFTDAAYATGSATASSPLTLTKPVGITGQDLQRAAVTFSSQTGSPEVALTFTAEGTKKFAEVTRRLVGKPLAIFLDQFPVSAPQVNTEITDGNALISGQFTLEEAKQLAIQLNAGALPVPVQVVSERTIGATLGAESVRKSLIAGLIGLLLVVSFMVAKYGRLGLIADFALVVYGLLGFSVFRLLPVTLTLPGIAGFILSIGMAVDSNILIFERFKEEKSNGKPWKIAIEDAFGKAWDSIKDANVTTLITCLILYNPGNWQFLPSSGLVRGFAVTLFIGVLISLFTGIIVTRTFVRVLYREK